MPLAKKTTISQDFYNQMKNNLKKDEPVITEEAVSSNETSKVEAPVAAAKTVSESDGKKEKYADVMNIRLSKGRRNEIKTFCSSCGVSITQYIESSFEYLQKEVAAGRIVISKGGITNVSQ